MYFLRDVKFFLHDVKFMTFIIFPKIFLCQRTFVLIFTLCITCNNIEVLTDIYSNREEFQNFFFLEVNLSQDKST